MKNRQDRIGEAMLIWEAAPRAVVGDNDLAWATGYGIVVEEDTRIEQINLRRKEEKRPPLTVHEELQLRLAAKSQAAWTEKDLLEDERATTIQMIRESVIIDLIALGAYESAPRLIATVDEDDDRAPLAYTAARELVRRRKLSRVPLFLKDAALPKYDEIAVLIRTCVKPHRRKLVTCTRRQILAYEASAEPTKVVELLVCLVYYAGRERCTADIEHAHRLIQKKIIHPSLRARRLVDLARTSGMVSLYEEAIRAIDALVESSERTSSYEYVIHAVTHAMDAPPYREAFEAAALTPEALDAISGSIPEAHWRRQLARSLRDPRDP